MAGLLYIGEDTPSGGAVRIMKDPAGDPHTTPRTDYDKFAFDSESGDLAYAYGLNPNVNSMSFIPVISSIGMYDSGWWEFASWMEQAYSGEELGFSLHTSLVASLRDPFTNLPLPWTAGPDNSPFVTMASYGSLPTRLASRTLAWMLPADGSAMPFPSSTGKVPGLDATGGRFRVPRAGKSFTSSTLTDFIIHENLRPAKIVAAGRVSVSGSLDVTLPVAVPSSAFIGGQFSETGAALTVPYVNTLGWSSITELRVQWQLVDGGRTLRFRERSGRSVDVTYYVVAEDGSGHTSGNAACIKTDVDSVTDETYLQVRRPGCAEPPNFADILLDSRWQCMPLIDYGYVPWGSFGSGGGGSHGGGGKRATRSIPTLGYRPLVLTSWYFEWGINKIYMDGYAAYWFYPSGPSNQFYAPTCYTQVSDGSLMFQHYFAEPNGWYYQSSPPGPGGEPIGWHRWWQDGSDYNGTGQSVDQFFYGVRYYVFAVPQG